ncbi:MAG: hypothetical protein JWN70_5858 [Planctomycetaceae bacterium]|nr:hypothetical protein [Planctomycetaceae bacterium]
MRSSMTSFLKVTSLLAVAGVLALAPVFAKDPAAAEAKASGKQAAAGAEGQPAPAIPECLAKLKLTAEQQDQIKGIVGQTEMSSGKVWGQFGERYTQMIKLEASMLAAIEDHLTEPQLMQVRTHRQVTARGRKIVVTRTTTAAAKPTTPAEKELAHDGITLTAQQAAASDKIQDQYQTNLETLHHEIQGLHARLLALEADKLVQIEKVLTKEQIIELKQHREMAPAALAVTSNETEPTKAE